jgi:hypothetical protein
MQEKPTRSPVTRRDEQEHQGESAEVPPPAPQCSHERREPQELSTWFGYSRCLDCGRMFSAVGGMEQP